MKISSIKSVARTDEFTAIAQVRTRSINEMQKKKGYRFGLGSEAMGMRPTRGVKVDGKNGSSTHLTEVRIVRAERRKAVFYYFHN